jgi:hypothetical protein
MLSHVIFPPGIVVLIFPGNLMFESFFSPVFYSEEGIFSRQGAKFFSLGKNRTQKRQGR